LELNQPLLLWGEEARPVGLFVGVPLKLICSLVQVTGGRRENCPINAFAGTREVAAEVLEQAANYGRRWDCFCHRQHETLGTGLSFRVPFYCF